MSFLSARSFENSDIVKAMLGSFWDIWFTNQEQVSLILSAICEKNYDVYWQTLEAARCISIDSVPVFSKENFRPLILTESSKLSADSMKNKYGDDLSYGTNGLTYGSLAPQVYDSYPIESTLMSCTHIYNQILNPTLVMTEGIDFFIDTKNSLIRFKEPISSNDLVPKKVTTSSGVITDTTYGLWCTSAQIDQQYIWQHFGYVMNLWMQSSTFYKEFLTSLWDLNVLGSSKQAVLLALAALTGIPFAAGVETVQLVSQSDVATTVVTDKNVYEFKPTAQPIVVVGDTVSAGTPLVDSVVLYEPGVNTDWSAISAVSVGRRFLGMPVKSSLTFQNKDVPLVYVGKDIEGRTLVKFEVNGLQSDLDVFWRTVHALGIKGKTLANYLDTRANPIGEPAAQDLPSTVNPFSFIIDNFFSNNMYGISMKPTDFADGAPGLQNLDHLRQYVETHTAYVIFVTLPPVTTQVKMDDIQDSVDFCKAVGTITDQVSGMVNSLGPVFWTEKERCQ